MTELEVAPLAVPEPTCVLVVDDDPSIREVVFLILSLEGYRVASAQNGREALEQLRAGVRPCVILLDLRMPEMDGWELRGQLMGDPELRAIPVVVISGDRDARQVAEDMAVNAVLLKPVELPELLQVVQRYC